MVFAAYLLFARAFSTINIDGSCLYCLLAKNREEKELQTHSTSLEASRIGRSLFTNTSILTYYILSAGISLMVHDAYIFVLMRIYQPIRMELFCSPERKNLGDNPVLSLVQRSKQPTHYP